MITVSYSESNQVINNSKLVQNISIKQTIHQQLPQGMHEVKYVLFIP